MRESVSETWTITQVAFFTLLMIAFLCVMISYARCFRVKNETLSIIEKYGAYSTDPNSQQIINKYLEVSGYEGTGTCSTADGFQSFTISNGSNYCVKLLKSDDDTNYIKYKVIVFYTFKIPSIGNIVSFQVTGKTHDLKAKDVDTGIFPTH